MVTTPVTSGKMQNDRALPYDFDIVDLLEESWQRVKGMKLAVWSAVVILIAIIVGFEATSWFISHFMQKRLANFLNFFVQLAEFLITFPLWIGISYLGIRRAVDLPLNALKIFDMYHYFSKLVGMVLLQLLIVYGLTIIFVLSLVSFDPALHSMKMIILLRCIQVILGFALIYMSLSFMFSYLLIIEKNLSVWKAYLASFLGFSQHWVKITVALAAMLIIYVAGAVTVIGLVWTVPMITNFMGILYRIIFGVEELPKLPSSP